MKNGLADVEEKSQGDDLLALPDYTPEEIAADLEHDRMMHTAWGDRIPVVRTLFLRGSKSDVLVRRKTPRP